MVTTVKVSVELQYGWKNNAERIRNVEKQLWQIPDSHLKSVYYFITRFFNEHEKVNKNVIKNLIRITITWAELKLIICRTIFNKKCN